MQVLKRYENLESIMTVEAKTSIPEMSNLIKARLVNSDYRRLKFQLRAL